MVNWVLSFLVSLLDFSCVGVLPPFGGGSCKRLFLSFMSPYLTPGSHGDGSITSGFGAKSLVL